MVIIIRANVTGTSKDEQVLLPGGSGSARVLPWGVNGGGGVAVGPAIQGVAVGCGVSGRAVGTAVGAEDSSEVTAWQASSIVADSSSKNGIASGWFLCDVISIGWQILPGCGPIVADKARS